MSAGGQQFLKWWPKIYVCFAWCLLEPLWFPIARCFPQQKTCGWMPAPYDVVSTLEREAIRRICWVLVFVLKKRFRRRRGHLKDSSDDGESLTNTNGTDSCACLNYPGMLPRKMALRLKWRRFANGWGSIKQMRAFWYTEMDGGIGRMSIKWWQDLIETKSNLPKRKNTNMKTIWSTCWLFPYRIGGHSHSLKVTQ